MPHHRTFSLPAALLTALWLAAAAGLGGCGDSTEQGFATAYSVTPRSGATQPADLAPSAVVADVEDVWLRIIRDVDPGPDPLVYFGPMDSLAHPFLYDLALDPATYDIEARAYDTAGMTNAGATTTFTDLESENNTATRLAKGARTGVVVGNVPGQIPLFLRDETPASWGAGHIGPLIYGLDAVDGGAVWTLTTWVHMGASGPRGQWSSDCGGTFDVDAPVTADFDAGAAPIYELIAAWTEPASPTWPCTLTFIAEADITSPPLSHERSWEIGP